jgi:carbon monoxide dehydrogenase subunit G
MNDFLDSAEELFRKDKNQDFEKVFDAISTLQSVHSKEHLKYAVWAKLRVSIISLDVNDPNRMIIPA